MERKNEMERGDLRNATILVAGDASVTACGEHGEVLWIEGLPLGSHKAAQYLPRLAEGDTLILEGAAMAMMRGVNRAQRNKYGEGSHESGANPHFVVTSASRHQRELDRKIELITARSDKLEKRLAAAETAKQKRDERLRAAKEPEAVAPDAETAKADAAKEPEKEPEAKENGGA